MSNNILTSYFLRELEAEAAASRKCVERIPESLFGWKPHERSMLMGYLAQLVAEIPSWITIMLEKSEIDFATYERNKPENTKELVSLLERNLEGARSALKKSTDANLAEMCYLKNNGKILMSMTKEVNTGTSLNHWVHHRGQLTVYMRLNNIAVPSIYGPSADDTNF